MNDRLKDLIVKNYNFKKLEKQIRLFIKNRKEVSELKSFVNKSKGTVAVLVFMATIVATVVGAWNYVVK